jgi:two-component system, NtrC family, response regulator GlrR
MRLLVMGCGGNATARTPLTEALRGTGDDGLECLTLGSPDLDSESEVLQVSRVLQESPHAVLLLWLGAGEVVRAAGRFFAVARRRQWDLPVLVLAEGATPKDLLQLLRLGASDFLSSPLRRADLVTRVWALAHETGEADRAFARLHARHGLEHIVGGNPAFLELVGQLPAMARSDACVLLSGETGTGKEVFARAIHYLSRRSAKPFVPVNCGAVPVDLLENEFFGHESGAFTNAGAARRGVIAEANGGTLLLDEIDCLPLLAQVKLLRFLQDGEFRPLGSERSYHADVRVIAATNVDLQPALESGAFRWDLYYRLNVLSLRLPPLRQRADDIPLLARSFLSKFAGKFSAPARDLSPAALTRLASHEWRGNVRELENVMERAVVLSEGALIRPEDLRIQPMAQGLPEAGFRELKARAIVEFERNYLRQLLLAHGGNITHAARAARKDRRAFWGLLRKHQLAGRLAASQPACGGASTVLPGAVVHGAGQTGV